MLKILIIEDDTSFSELLEGFLTKHGFVVNAFAKIQPALKTLAKESFQLVLVDYRLPDGNGLEVLKFLREEKIALPVIMMTSFNDVKTAVNSIRLGAFDYILKPVNPDELLLTIKNALKQKEQKAYKSEDESYIKGESDVSKKIYQHVDLVAPTDMSVIIQGESGTGKEHIARLLHMQSKRKDKPFIAIDCGALSKDLAVSELFGHTKGAFTGAITDKKGQFELANGGTLFLDEVGNLSYEVQVKLLRALQEKVIQPLGGSKTFAVDVRIITATNDDLQNSINNGDFRDDLYHRLNQFKIQLPPLRERGDDLKLFVNYFIQQSNNELDRNVIGLSKEVKDILYHYEWPGNLRELSNVIKRMVLLSAGSVVEVDALPDEMVSALNEPKAPASTTDLKSINEINEKVLIEQTLKKTKYNKSKAAKILNIDRKTLYAKMERYQIE
ncbi:MAG TPA: sigma-54 dependent transcriptional regulator [Pelobium sp.]